MSEANNYLSEVITDEEKAIDGAKLIIAQKISETLKYREKIRENMMKKLLLVLKKLKKRMNWIRKKYIRIIMNIVNLLKKCYHTEF